MNRHDIESLIAKSFKEELSYQERIELDGWLKSEDNYQLFMNLKTIWKEAGTIEPTQQVIDVDTEQALLHTKNKISSQKPSISLPKRT